MTDTSERDGRGAPAARSARPNFRAMVAELEAAAPTEAELDAARAGARLVEREERLRAAGVLGIHGGPLPEDDVRSIVAGGLDDTHALKVVRRWFAVRAPSTTNETLEERDARLRAARRFTTLALVGGTGRGKTVAAAWLIAELGGVYLTAEELRVCFDSRAANDREHFRHALRTRVLVVDDLGTETHVPTAAAAVNEIVNQRQGNASAWTLLTSNLSTEDLRERYGERAIRRIEHMGHIVEVTGDDMRRGGKR